MPLGKGIPLGLNPPNQELKGHLQFFSFPVLTLITSIREHKSQPLVSAGSLSFAWKQSHGPALPVASGQISIYRHVVLQPSVLNTSIKMEEVPGSVKAIFGKYPSSIRFNDSVLLNKSCLSIGISEPFNSSSFIPLTVGEVLVLKQWPRLF